MQTSSPLSRRCQGTHQTERIEDVWAVSCKMIAVVILLEHPCHLFLAHPIVLRHQFDVLVQGGGKFLFSNAADGSKLWVHGDVGQIVDGAEDAELRELGYTRDEGESDVFIISLDWGIKFLVMTVLISANLSSLWSTSRSGASYSSMIMMTACLFAFCRNNQVLESVSGVSLSGLFPQILSYSESL